MREIKFRWFRRRNKEITYDLVTEVEVDGSFGTVEDSEWTIFAGQYTGLKDKNGVEIYEGDLLRNPNNMIRVISFKEGSYVAMSKNQKLIRVLDKGFLRNKIVIGNIYENPELL